MTDDAKIERVIVAWLREQTTEVKECEELSKREKDHLFFMSQVNALTRAADAIERGEHRKETT